MLNSSVIKVSDLTEQNISTMFELMSGYFDNLKKENFISDLVEKEDILIMRNEKDEIKGFSTLAILDLPVNGETVKLLFSGDSIVHYDYWGDRDATKTWIEYAYQKLDSFQEKFYWLLLSKGYKTYKFLPVFFNEFYPRANTQTPEFEQAILDNYGYTYYKEFYNKEKGIIEMNQQKDYLKDWLADIPESKLKDENIAFFANKNPDYSKGNELVCLARITRENLKKSGRKIVVG